MTPFWLTFTNRVSGCVEAPTKDEARTIGSTFGDVASCDELPYPANPRLNTHVDPKFGECPSFCWTPTACVGRRSCPASHSCTE